MVESVETLTLKVRLDDWSQAYSLLQTSFALNCLEVLKTDSRTQMSLLCVLGTWSLFLPVHLNSYRIIA